MWTKGCGWLCKVCKALCQYRCSRRESALHYRRFAWWLSNRSSDWQVSNIISKGCCSESSHCSGNNGSYYRHSPLVSILILLATLGSFYHFISQGAKRKYWNCIFATGVMQSLAIHFPMKDHLPLFQQRISTMNYSNIHPFTKSMISRHPCWFFWD